MRGKLLNGKSLPQIVEEAFSKPELVGLCGKDAWRALPEAIAKWMRDPLSGFCIGPVLDALHGLEVKLDPVTLIFLR
jgi:hypothetical protein